MLNTEVYTTEDGWKIIPTATSQYVETGPLKFCLH